MCTYRLKKLVLQASWHVLLPQFYNFLGKAGAIIKDEVSDVCNYIGAEYIVQLVKKLTTDKYKFKNEWVLMPRYAWWPKCWIVVWQHDYMQHPPLRHLSACSGGRRINQVSTDQSTEWFKRKLMLA